MKSSARLLLPLLSPFCKMANTMKKDSIVESETGYKQKIAANDQVTNYLLKCDSMWLYYYWLKAKSQNPLLINRPSNQRDLPEAELARREVRIERRPLSAGGVLEAADLLRIIQASLLPQRLQSQRS
jgi:hypothetical protein